MCLMVCLIFSLYCPYGVIWLAYEWLCGGGKMTKYCLDLMELDSSGRFRLVSREYLNTDDDDGKKDLRLLKKQGVEFAVKKWRWDKDAEGGEYLVTFFREKRKRNGAIKSKKKIDGYRFEV